MITTYGPSIWFGEMTREERPELPKGFRYELREGHWAKVVGPDERAWFISTNPKPRLIGWEVATKDDVRRTKGRLKRGSLFMGTRQVLISFLVVNDKTL